MEVSRPKSDQAPFEAKWPSPTRRARQRTGSPAARREAGWRASDPPRRISSPRSVAAHWVRRPRRHSRAGERLQRLCDGHVLLIAALIDIQLLALEIVGLSPPNLIRRAAQLLLEHRRLQLALRVVLALPREPVDGPLR